MGTSHQFSLIDLYDDVSISKSVGRNQINRNIAGDLKALKTSASVDSTPRRSITTWAASDTLQGLSAIKPMAVFDDVFNQTTSNTLTGILQQHPEAIGSVGKFGPYDVLSKALSNPAAGVTLNGLVSDGSTGPQSIAPPPTGNYRGTTEMRNIWGNTCAIASSLTTIQLWSGASISVRKECEEVFRLIDGIMKKYQYSLRKDVTGAFNCRKITGGTGLSLHSFGIAADYNWDTNPYGPTLITDMPGQMISEIEHMTSKSSGILAVRWGGRYDKNKDAMHFEVMLTPAELAEGIAL